MIIILTVEEVSDIINEVTFMLRCSRPDDPDDRREIFRLTTAVIHPDSETSSETIDAIRNEIGIDLIERYFNAITCNSFIGGLLSRLVKVDIMNESGDIAFHFKL